MADPASATQSPLFLRPATLSDLPSLSHVASAAFSNDHFFLHQNPNLGRHPHHFREQLLRHLRLLYYTPNYYLVVVEVRESKELVGYSIWECISRCAAPTFSPVRWLNRLLVSTEERYVRAFRLDKAVDQKRAAAVAAQAGKDFTELDEYWHLRQLAVRPGWQRRGIGGMLLDWGIERAREECVPVGLEASPVGKALYTKKGFRVYRWPSGVEGVGGGQNEDGTWTSDPVMIWEPPIREVDKVDT